MVSSSLSERSLYISAFGAIVAGNVNLHARYSPSAAFDRPIHFSIATLILAGLVFLGFAKVLGHQSPAHQPQGHGQRRQHEAPALLDSLKSCLRSASRPSTFVYLVVSLVLRVLLNWRIIRAIQCSWDGLYPYATTLTYGPSIYRGMPPMTTTTHLLEPPASRFAVLTLLWGYAVASLSLLAERTAGVICPTGWYIERFTPLAQLGAVFLDAVIISQVARLRQANHDQTSGVWHLLGTWLWTSATVLSFLAMWSVLDRANSAANIFLTALEFRDVVIDSTLATFTLVFGVYLLGSFRANLVSLVVTGTTVSVLILSNSFDSTTNVMWLGVRGLTAGLVVFLVFGALLYLCQTNLPFGVSLHREHALAMGRYCIYALAAFLLVLFPAFFMRPHDDRDISPRRTMIAGRAESDAWLADAMKSTSLQSAVEEYRRRYRMPPPPNFDKWYEFALSVNSSVIDAFDQIDSDLLPFWAIPPTLLSREDDPSPRAPPAYLWAAC
ncbi:hypothetical protein CIB48_g5509 [Xylaria polymorpha]|nr:hypothetical protein CIB48_g5509 [Xylaria polymorpha]